MKPMITIFSETHPPQGQGPAAQPAETPAASPQTTPSQITTVPPQTEAIMSLDSEFDRRSQKLVSRWKEHALHWAKPLPFRSRQYEYSVISSVDDQAGAPTESLIQKVLDAVQCAKTVDLSAVSARLRQEPLYSTTEPLYPDIWPGEHYKLLAGFMESLRPAKVVEVGTYQGLSALALLARLPRESRLLTLDIVPWDQMRPTFLRATDFSDGRLHQVLGDLSQRDFFDQFSRELSTCEFLFVDAPKNVVFERTLLEFLEEIPTSPNLLVVFDDIRQWNMLSIWREIRRPKMDLTSFGHWSGTGVVEWNGGQVRSRLNGGTRGA